MSSEAPVADAAEIQRLDAEIAALGEKVRNLKTSGAEKAEVTAGVQELLAAKRALALAKGEDPDAAKKAKKEKKKKGGALDADGKPKLTKKELRMQKKQEEAEARAAAAAAAAASEDSPFGDLPLIQSTEITERGWVEVENLESAVGRDVWVRARLHTSRVVGKGAFLVLRAGVHTVQGVAFQSDAVPKAMVKYIGAITRETVVDVFGTVTQPAEPVAGTTLSGVELQVKKVFSVSKSSPILPFTLEDASRPDADNVDADGNVTGGVGMDLRLDNRWIDLRTQANQAILRVKSMVCLLFREFLSARGFTEIQTPKLLGGASEGGSEVFTFDYFGRTACLAQSPQLYKQICAACAGLEKVFEVGPVFRAERSNTHRHLCEFTGLDLEMAIKEHYFEVLDLMGDLFAYIFDGINARCGKELEIIAKQHPFEPITYLPKALRLTFAEGAKLLHEAGVEGALELTDLTTAQERKLGAIVKERYGTDFFILDKFPMAARPFYTMPDPEDETLSNSYDFFIRGEEIVSGAQRVHDVDLLIKRAEANDIPVESIKGYIDSFRHGALPHGGGGIGLERVVMLFLGLPNIRKVATFPRDPNRVTP